MNSINLKSFLRNTARSLAVSVTLTAASYAADKPFSKIVTFGDSLSDTGNAFLYTGGLYPATPPNAAGRISNGALWTEHLAQSLGMELQPEDQYAVAGARTDQDNFNAIFIPPLAGTGLESQIATYLNDSGAQGADPAALHTIWIGANDIFTTLTFGGDIGLTVYTAIQNTAQAVVTLSSGGAGHILVANLPDLGLTPFGLDSGPQGSAQLSYLTNLYNAGLKQALDSLENAGIRTIRLDTAGLIREIAANPAAFGLVNATDQALDSGNDAAGYLFWDGVHPTTAGHRIVATRAIDELIGFYSPRKGRGKGPGLVRSLNGLVRASSR
jgi:phospholipase/lecithinase/hemolysin